MKIAIFHNFLDNIGGAEIATLHMARGLGADIFTTNIDLGKVRTMGFTTDRIFSIGRVPTEVPFRHEATYWRFKRLNLGQRYDFYIISGDWAVGAATNHQPNLWYVFSPARELWDLSSYVRSNLVPWYGRGAFDVWATVHRHLMRRDVMSVDQVVSISNIVQKRVKKFLNRESTVVYPAVDTKKFVCSEYGDFWLSVNRLIRHKRIELQLEAFRRLPNEKLVIVGSYEPSRHFREYADFLFRTKPSNVEIVSWIEKPALIDLYSRCRGVISTSLDEDFGLTAIEAMASGKPIIAPAEGGYMETVIDGTTGRLLLNIEVDTLVSAITEVGSHPQSFQRACLSRAEKFGFNTFIEEIRKRVPRSSSEQ